MPTWIDPWETPHEKGVFTPIEPTPPAPSPAPPPTPPPTPTPAPPPYREPRPTPPAPPPEPKKKGGLSIERIWEMLSGYMPWWTNEEKSYYESLPWSQRPWTAFGLKPPEVPTVTVTEYAKDVLRQKGLPENASASDFRGWIEREGLVDMMGQPPPGEEWGLPPTLGVGEGGLGELALPPPPFPTTQPPANYHWEWDSASMRYVATPDKPEATMSEWQRWQAQMAEQEAAREQEQWLRQQMMSEDEATRRAAQEQWERSFAERQFQWEQQTWGPQPMSEYQRAQLAWQQEQAQQEWQQQQQWQQWQQQQALWQRGLEEQQFAQRQLEAQQQYGLQQQQLGWEYSEAQRQAEIAQQNYLAQLAAQPMSWLQYSAAAQQTPAIQPWMMPLMSQQYSELGAGQPIPGIQAGSMAGMPQLATPSAQYWQRMGPTAQQQFLGYRQARTGATPQEIQFRMASAAPPGRQPSIYSVPTPRTPIMGNVPMPTPPPGMGGIPQPSPQQGVFQPPPQAVTPVGTQQPQMPMGMPWPKPPAGTEQPINWFPAVGPYQPSPTPPQTFENLPPMAPWGKTEQPRVMGPEFVQGGPYQPPPAPPMKAFPTTPTPKRTRTKGGSLVFG